MWFSLSQGGVGSASLFTFLLLCSTFASGLKSPAHGHAKFHHREVDLVHSDAPAQSSHRSTYRTVAYYVNWAIYGRNSPPQDIPVSALTHILYAFAGINNKTGEAYLTDTWADVQKTWPGDVPSNTSVNMFGNLKQLYLHKKANRNLKTLLSIGGWSLRTYFAPALATETGRRTFAKSSVQLLKDLGFDGLDIDWEYPSSPKEASDLVDTCRLFREELDSYSLNLTSKPHFLLALSVPAGPAHFRYFDVPNLAPYVDFISLMAYDYMGSGFSNSSGHAQNVYKSKTNPRSTQFDTITPVEYYLQSGMEPRKLNLGMPLYGRSFANTSGPGTRFSPATEGSWENGVWDYKVLPQNGSHVYHDDSILASWSYNNRTRSMVSYDTPAVAKAKAKYLVGRGLGGAMWWETSGDRPLNDSRSLIRTVAEEFQTCGGLEQCENVLDFPYSKYQNLREGMPGQ